MLTKKLMWIISSLIITSGLLALLMFNPLNSSASDSPGMTIFLEPNSPLGAGPVKITILARTNVVAIPSLVLVESDQSTTPINLQGDVPGKVFTGVLRIDDTVAEGSAYFEFANPQMSSGAGLAGTRVRIDKTPPSKPLNLHAVIKR